MNILTCHCLSPHGSLPTLVSRWVLMGSVVLTGLLFTATASAQITPSRSLTAGGSPVATLEEQLINRLHATTEVQGEYIRYIVKLVDEQKLEARLVVAIEQYAIRRNPQYAFPYFERALRYEAAKRGVGLPALRHYQSTAGLRR